MSKWNRPMRRYSPPVLICARCGRRITGEVRMLGRELYHTTCAGLERG